MQHTMCADRMSEAISEHSRERATRSIASSAWRTSTDFRFPAPSSPSPQTMKWGFASLLIFVVSTIIGGIAAKLIYNDVLANVDYIHGVAESLLGKRPTGY